MEENQGYIPQVGNILSQEGNQEHYGQTGEELQEKLPLVHQDIDKVIDSDGYIVIISYDKIPEFKKADIKAGDQKYPCRFVYKHKLCYFCLSKEMEGKPLSITIRCNKERTQILPAPYTNRIIAFEISPTTLAIQAKSKKIDVLMSIFGLTVEEKLKKLLKLGIKFKLSEMGIVGYGATTALTSCYNQYGNHQDNTYISILIVACLGIFKKNGYNTKHQEFTNLLLNIITKLRRQNLQVQLKNLDENEQATFWSGVQVLVSNCQAVNALEIFKFSEIINFPTIELSAFQANQITLKKSIEMLKSFPVSEENKNELFKAHVNVPYLRKYYIDMIMHEFKPSRVVLKELYNPCKDQVERALVNYQLQESMKNQPLSEQNCYFPQIGQIENERTVAFYLFFQHFTHSEEVFLISSNKSFEMTKIPNFPAYLVVIQLSKDLKEISYKYKWKQYQSQNIKRTEIAELDIVYDTPCSFGQILAKSQKQNLFLQVLKFYLVNRGRVPFQFLVNMSNFMKILKEISLNNRQVIQLLDQLLQSSTRMVLLGELKLINQTPFKQQLAQKSNDVKKIFYPQTWIKDVINSKNSLPQSELTLFRTGLTHYLKLSDINVKLTAFELAPVFLQGVSLSFKNDVTNLAKS